MRIAYAIAIILLVIGGLAWGIVGLFDVNILEMFGIRSPVTIAIYVLIGLAAILVAIGGQPVRRRLHPGAGHGDTLGPLHGHRRGRRGGHVARLLPARAGEQAGKHAQKPGKAAVGHREFSR